MNYQRLFRHWRANRWQLNRAFPDTAMRAIEQAIGASESRHGGEVRFAVETALDNDGLFAGVSARERAIDVFSQLRMWDTDQRNGVLIYVLYAERSVEIIADRGVNAVVGAAVWQAICERIQAAFAAGRFQDGVLTGIEEITVLLAQYFPPNGMRRNELPDTPVRL